MTSNSNTPSKRHTPHRRDHEIDRRYGEIGISAVAAAVRCQNFDDAASRERVDERRSREEPSDKAA